MSRCVFARAGVADEYDRFGTLEVATLCQVAQLSRRDRRRLTEVELVQGLDVRQVSLFDAPLDRASLAILQLSCQQGLQVTQVRLTLAFGLLRQWNALGGDRRQVEDVAVVGDDVLPQRRLALCARAHRAPPATSRSSYACTRGSGRS